MRRRLVFRTGSAPSAASRTALCLALVGLVVAGAGLSGCTSPKNALGTSTSPCFRALPIAHGALGALGDKATLLGVRYLTVKVINADLERTNQRWALITDLPAGTTYPVCTVGYEDQFVASKLSHPWPPGRQRARYALVLVDLRHLKLLATVLLDRLPLRLSKL